MTDPLFTEDELTPQADEAAATEPVNEPEPEPPDEDEEPDEDEDTSEEEDIEA